MAHYRRYRLPFTRPWTSAAGRFAWREGALLQLTTADGRQGFGECAPLGAAGFLLPPKQERELAELCRYLPGRVIPMQLADFPNFRVALPMAFSETVWAALECALLDLLAQTLSLPLAALFSKEANTSIPVNAVLGTATEVTPEAIKQAVAQGFSVLKFKVGVGRPEQEPAHLSAMDWPAAVRLRLDANRAWDETTAARFITACAALPIESLEEPLAQPTPAALSRLQALSPFALALDESWRADWAETVFAHPPVRRLVLKPLQQGGLLACHNLAARAHDAGMEVVVTSTLESACGLLAVAHLAAALNGELAHGLATSSWLASNTGASARIQQGRLRLPEHAGLGFSPFTGLHQAAFPDSPQPLPPTDT